jgi:hypothetical protein
MGYYEGKHQINANTAHEMYDYEFYNESSYYRKSISDTDFKKALEPVISQLQKYDKARHGLERYGGHIRQLYDINKILNEEIRCVSEYNVSKCTLAKIKDIRTMLFEIRYFDKFSLHIDVRKHSITGMPVFYLCKEYMDYDARYGFIVEDLYQSPGYYSPYRDFIKLMYGGHEVYFLNLSQFNKKIQEELFENSQEPAQEACNLLFKMGYKIFQDAWHEDQIVAKTASNYFDMPNFKEAIDLLYLCLSGDLCELRGEIDDQMISFFEIIYPHKTIHSLLNFIKTLDGSDLSELNQKARKLYIKLLKASSKFFNLEIQRGTPHITISVQKLILGNLFRLSDNWKELKENSAVKKGAKLLDNESKSIIDELFGTTNNAVSSTKDWDCNES